MHFGCVTDLFFHLKIIQSMQTMILRWISYTSKVITVLYYCYYWYGHINWTNISSLMNTVATPTTRDAWATILLLIWFIIYPPSRQMPFFPTGATQKQHNITTYTYNNIHIQQHTHTTTKIYQKTCLSINRQQVGV